MIFARIDLEKMSSSGRTYAAFDDFIDSSDPDFAVRQGRLLEGRELWVYDEDTGAVGRGLLEIIHWEGKYVTVYVYSQTVITDVRYSVHYDYTNDTYSLDQD